VNAAIWCGTDIRLKLVIQPKARRDDWVGVHGDEIKLAITAPPIDGKANLHLQKFLAKSCKVAKSAVIIEQGQLSRHKTVRVQTPQQLPDLLKKLLADN
jgi:uncharacterized protein